MSRIPSVSFPVEYYLKKKPEYSEEKNSDGKTEPKKSSIPTKKADLDPRPFFVKATVVDSSNGSAYLEAGETKVLATVHGPRNVGRQEAQGLNLTARGNIEVSVRFAPFAREIRLNRKEQRRGQQESAGNDEEMKIAESIKNAFSSVVILESFPKAQVDIKCTILQDDGSVLSALLSCISVALADGCIEMYDLLIGTTICITDPERYSVDPTSEEETLDSDNSREKLAYSLTQLSN